MNTKDTKTILFGSLLAILPVSFAIRHTGMISSSDIPQYVDDSRMAFFLDGMVGRIGTAEATCVLNDSSAVTCKYRNPLDGKAYKVRSVAAYQGSTINNETITVMQHTNNTVQMINEKHGFSVVFSKDTNSQPNEYGKIRLYDSINLRPMGSGSSDACGAKVDLYDNGYKSTADEILHLEDSYDQCDGIREYTVSASVMGTSYTTRVHWNSDLFYFHWCIMLHAADHGKVSLQGDSHEWSGTNYRADGHEFSHGSNTGTFRVEADTWYGSW